MVLWIISKVFSFKILGCYHLWRSFPTLFFYDTSSLWYVRNPSEENFTGLACSAFARRYLRNRISFSSSGYLDVSVPRVPHMQLWIHYMLTEVSSAGFPHSDISGSLDMCSSPKLFAAYHVFHRLLVPRHPPYALISITNLLSFTGMNDCLHMHSVACVGISGRFFTSFSRRCKLIITLRWWSPRMSFSIWELIYFCMQFSMYMSDWCLSVIRNQNPF